MRGWGFEEVLATGLLRFILDTPQGVSILLYGYFMCELGFGIVHNMEIRQEELFEFEDCR